MLPSRIRVFIASQPTDMRKSFNGLAAVVQNELGRDPLSGDVFVFHNRRGHLMKLLLWDRGGFWIFYKRLEKGRFKVPAGRGKDTEIAPADLAMILEGIDLAGARRRTRYALPRQEPSSTRET